MIPVSFDYVRAESADHALELLAEHGDEAKLLAGGHSLLPLMKLRLATPAVLVDVGRLRDLSYVVDQGDHIAIGALTRHRDVETSPVLAEHVPLLACTAGHVGDPQVRHRGTIGGSLAHGDPASDLPAAVLALGGTLVAQVSRTRDRGRRLRRLPRDLFAPTSCSLRSALKVTGAGWAFKFNRRAQD
jgi:carbon-monoxide dehydrogenase medium subunit